MTSRHWLVILAVAGIAIFALSFVDLWIVHDREVRGEGYRFVSITSSAWQEPGFPVMAIGVVAALLVGLLAVASVVRAMPVPRWLLLTGSALSLAVLLSGAWPVAQDGHASSVDLSAGVALLAGIGLALLLVGAAFAGLRPGRRVVGAAGAIALVALVVGAGGRWLGLQWAEGTGRHWSEGSYTRTATGDQPTETLTIEGEAVTIGDRWSGSWEWSGWTVSIDGDPACPDDRGTYHAHGEGDDDLSFVMVVDPCRDGARAADLQTGIWERQP